MSKKPTGFSDRKARYRHQTSGPGRRAVLPPPEPEALPDGTVRYFLKLGPKGRVLFPADMRAAME
jgi:hypothetical protein